jgi:DNA-directed RNA polymerase specialized sigma24 family protein
VLGCSRVAVKTMIHRARKKLLPLVQELGPDRPALAAAMAEVSHE